MRRNGPIWRRGSFEIVGIGEGWLAFARAHEGVRALVVVNAKDVVQEISREVLPLGGVEWKREGLVEGTSAVIEISEAVVEIAPREVEIFMP